MTGVLATILAHPDDETFGTGGTLIRYASEGVAVHSLCLTEGEQGWAGGEGAPLIPREHVGAARALELAEAGRRMGLRSVTCFKYPDGGLAGVNPDYVVRDIVRWLRRVRPDVVITWGPDGGYGHPDHIKTHRITVQAVFHGKDVKRFPGGEPWQPSKLYYTAFPRSAIKEIEQAMKAAGMEDRFGEDEETPFGVPDDRVSASIDVSQYVDKKIAAMQAHRTQIPPDSWFMKLRDVLGPRAWGREYFERARTRVNAPIPENDLFAGLR